MTKLSVNINKLATLRNARGGNNPDLLKTTKLIEQFGADGITVHPRPDQRHIRYSDVSALKKIITTELNIEGNCREQQFVDLVLATKPTQVTLVPDTIGQLTSDHGWDTVTHQEYLKKMVSIFKEQGIRVSLFVDPMEEMIRAAKETGTDRVELYTEQYATLYQAGEKEKAIAPYYQAALVAKELALSLNAGHDLDHNNLRYFHGQIPWIKEVSIGHALVCDALLWGLENTIQLYKRELQV
ncbi:MAG: pyridoxine 5'-phosphate synthase [Bacteroidetes bacterium]|nr:pyridoxine 5'-phosphate synthase [Bacteroidota bacterium]